MLKTSRFLQITFILALSVIFTGCYTVISKTNIHYSYPYSRLDPVGEEVTADQEEYEDDAEYDGKY